MQNSNRSLRLIAISAGLSGLLVGPSAVALGPAQFLARPPAGPRLAAVHAPLRTLRPRAESGRPVELEERLRILREHGKTRRTQDPPASSTPPDAATVLTPSPAPRKARREPGE